MMYWLCLISFEFWTSCMTVIVTIKTEYEGQTTTRCASDLERETEDKMVTWLFISKEKKELLQIHSRRQKYYSDHSHNIEDITETVIIEYFMKTRRQGKTEDCGTGDGLSK